MAFGPDGLASVRSRLVDVRPTIECVFGIDGVECLFGSEAIEPAAAQMAELVDENRADRAELALVARLAQDPRRGIAATVAERGEVDFHQPYPIEVGQQDPCIVARFQADGGGIGLLAERIDGNGRIGDGFVAPEAVLGLNHRSPP